MTLQIAEDSKLNKHCCNYFVLIAIFCIASVLSALTYHNISFAKLPPEETYTKYPQKGGRYNPGVMKTARYCRGAEKFKDKDFMESEDTTDSTRDSYRKMYNKCATLGYCKEGVEGDYPDKTSGPVCENAFKLTDYSDCVYYGAHHGDNEDREIYEGYKNCTNLVCDEINDKPCCDYEHDKKCNEAKKRVDQDKKLADIKGDAGVRARKIDEIQRDAIANICSRFSGDKKKYNDCKNTFMKKVTDCVDQLAKSMPIESMTFEKIYNNYHCITNDSKLKKKFALPDKIDPNASIGAVDAEDNSDQKKCSDNAGFFGFFWCPGINMLTEVFDTITGMITGGLKWTILVDTRASSEHVNKDPHHIIYNTWSSVLGVANIVMIIGFIAILYSYALNSNNVAKAYNVKTLMSRLIIVAIATNFSFYICAALADLSNIAGVGIYDLIRDTIPGNGDGPFSISGLGTAISVVVGATILIVLAYMSLHLVILSLIIILALITLRQIALLMLVIVSPLAFACYLFPNTAKWFTKWWNYYIQLLIVFPLFTAVWASSRLVASVLELTHQSNLITTVLSAVTPLLAIIPIFKMSGGLMSKMTNGLQKRASKWEGRDNLRRKRVANFAKRNSMALQNKLGSVQLGDHGMGRILSGAAHLAGGGIGLVGGTLAAAANARASDNLDELSGQAVKDINKEYEEKQQKKADEKIEEFAKKNHVISDEMASTIKQTIGNNPVKYTQNETGERSNPIITGAIAIKYMAMTGRGVDGKLLDQNTYRAALKYADEHIVMSNDEFNIAVYNVQQNGDKDTRSDFIKRHTDPDKSNHSIFMSKPGQNDFINQTGIFSKNRFESDDELANIAAQERTQKGTSPEQKQTQNSTSARQAQINMQKSTLAGESLDYSRRQYISSLNSAVYNNLSDAARYKLARQTILRKDTASANIIHALHTRVHHDINIIKVNDNTKHNMEVIDKALRSFTDKRSGHGPNL